MKFHGEEHHGDSRKSIDDRCAETVTEDRDTVTARYGEENVTASIAIDRGQAADDPAVNVRIIT